MVCSATPYACCTSPLSPRRAIQKNHQRLLLVYRLEKTRSYQEFQLLERLRSHNINVPKPVAAQAIRYGLLYRADLLSEKTPNARDLFSIRQDRKLSETRYRSIGTEIRKMHDVGIHHADLNIHNILIDDSDQVWIIDFDKCVAKAGDSWKTNNLSRLLRSFRKEREKRHIHWHEDSWDALQRGYKG
ncbi:3-deoxy-D-manno-octulosonic-acid kinase [marine gamma proteobacterium HTCC2143]|uniref:3-deoxy-D-manno-octulosonic acid kinase n=1 Tax=marine gamma proteobacterium HTCC2143 TaxID=247633 RepID=A0YBN8_9GAMM|nr:3-deoxy-D-manno-octulosonic-acid kinase [marine gamma proteobacterium HTCC2143]